MTSTIVVGAGTAGCLVARRLVEAGHRVTLLEAGPGLPAPSSISQANWLAAQREVGWHWPDLVATRTRLDGADAAGHYLRGRGVGGSSAINGMLTTLGPRSDFDRWEIAGVDRARVTAAIEQVQYDNPVVTVDPGTLSIVASPIFAQQGWTVEAAPLNLTASASGDLVRRSAAHYLEGLDAGRFQLVTDSAVDRLVIAGGSAGGAQLANGDVIEADDVVLAAGAVHSPVILLRSGIASIGSADGSTFEVGHGAADHPSIALTVSLDPALRSSDPSQLPITVMAERAGVQVLVMDHVMASADDSNELGVVTVALLDPASTGSVSLGDDGNPQIDLGLLSAGDDAARLLAASREVAAMLATIDGVTVLNPPPGAAASSPTPESTQWLIEHLGPYSHITATCPLGAAVDHTGSLWAAGVGDKLVDGLRVIDSSVLPFVPATNPMLPTLVLAEVLVGAARGPS